VQDDSVLADKYLAFYSILKGLCHKQRMIETFNFVRIKISFSKGSTPVKGTNTSGLTGLSGLTALSSGLTSGTAVGDKKGK